MHLPGVRTLATRAAIATAVAGGCAAKPPASRAIADVTPEPRTSEVTSAATAAADRTERHEQAPPRSHHATFGPGFPESGPWVSFYGTAAEMRDLPRVARTYRIINIDADPGARNFTDVELATLRAGGNNRVLSYMNVGACETYRTYWSSAPRGLLSCAANVAAHRGSYEGYPDETWMDLGNSEYQSLILEHVAPRLAARVDGFYLDNLELVEHSASSSNGPCSPSCRQGGLDLVRRLRDKFPDHLIVMQNATSDVTRLGTTAGRPFALLLDGVAHEEVYAPAHDAAAEAELAAWDAMGLASRGGHRFWIGVEDYVGSCRNARAARTAAARARSRGSSPYASDESGGQRVVCFWE